MADGRRGAGPEVLAHRDTVAAEVQRVAGEVAADHPHGFTAIAVLKSAVPFLADLVRSVTVPVRVEFVALAPFDGDTKQTRLVKDIEQPVAGEPVVLVTGTFDTGLTTDFVTRHLAALEPSSVQVATLADKPARRLLPTGPRYAVIRAPDVFLVGYGLDYAGRYRNLPDLWAVDVSQLADDPDRFVGELYGVGPTGS